jgi:hypothetical protein
MIIWVALFEPLQGEGRHVGPEKSSFSFVTSQAYPEVVSVFVDLLF